MYLVIGNTYAALLTDGMVIRFRFEGCDKYGAVMIETSPGSGKRVRFDSVFSTSNWLAYWLIAERPA